ncbi:hypothetical protein V3C99_016627, partial [Haemonchus contortus]
MCSRGNSRDLRQVCREFVSVPTIQPEAISSHLSYLWAIQSGIRDRFGSLQGSCRLPHLKRFRGMARCPHSISRRSIWKESPAKTAERITSLNPAAYGKGVSWTTSGRRNRRRIIF